MLIFQINFIIQIVTEDSQIATKDHYLAFPIELIGENRYRVTLVIQDVQESEQKFDHSLKISTRFKKDSEPIHSVTHKYVFNNPPSTPSSDTTLSHTILRYKDIIKICQLLAFQKGAMQGTLRFLSAYLG